MSSRLLQKTSPFLAIPVLFATACLSSCTTLYSSVSSAPSDLSGNWQIQSAFYQVPFSMTGPMQIQGSQVTANLHTAVDLLLDGSLISYSGTYDSTTGTLTLTSAPALVQQSTVNVHVELTVSSNHTGDAPGTVGITGLHPSVGPWAATAMEIPPLTGTYTGTLTSSTSTGSAILTVSQSSTPNGSGQFPVTGTLKLSAPTCNDTASISGTISGARFILASANATITGDDTGTGTTLTTAIAFTSAACNAANYTGTLNLQ